MCPSAHSVMSSAVEAVLVYIALLVHVKKELEKGGNGEEREKEGTEKRGKGKREGGERGGEEEKDYLAELEEDVSSCLQDLLQVALTLRGEHIGAHFFFNGMSSYTV